MQSKLSENFGKSLPYLELFWGPEGGGAEISLGARPQVPHGTAPAYLLHCYI